MKETSPIVPTTTQLRKPLPSLFKQNFIQTSSLVMMWRSVAEKLNGFDAELRVGEDLDYWLRLLGTGHLLRWTGKDTCHYTKHHESTMAKTLLVAEESVKLFRKHLGSTYLPLSLRKQQLVNSLHTHGRMQWRQNRDDARHVFTEAYKYQPFNCRCAIYAIAALLCGKRGSSDHAVDAHLRNGVEIQKRKSKV